MLLKTLPELDQWFHGYEQLKGSQNNEKQKKLNYFLYLTINASDFQLIPLDSNTFMPDV